ncbi:inositol monophosphatase family protein [Amycolatopsis pigmentata]|uniref:Inositol-1-monophosphatase n=1 Tax=Amycolatopsis pigmentata TaxID=450801 RepID=A0ABW5FV64_9PSEU
MTAGESALRDVAVKVAEEAAELVRNAREAMVAGQRMPVETKSSDTDVVTAVDRASEDLIRRRLAELRPGEAVLGEEGGGAEGSGGEGEGDGVTWVVDPIDGTVNFLYGSPVFAVSVAAQVAGRSVAGAVVEPASGRVWTAVRGQGAWLDGRPLRVSAPARLEVTLLSTGFSYLSERRARQARVIEGLLSRVRDVRRGGSGALDLCAVGAGWTDAYFEHGLNRWDWAAGALVAAEAGAVVSLPGDDPGLGTDATFAAAPSIAAPLRDLLAAHGAKDV